MKRLADQIKYDFQGKPNMVVESASPTQTPEAITAVHDSLKLQGHQTGDSLEVPLQSPVKFR